MTKEVLRGRVVSVNTSKATGVRKERVHLANLIASKGIEGDAHAGNWHRQVSLLAVESIEKMRRKGVEVYPGDFAENITIEGFPIMDIPVGSRIRIGEKVLIEITQIGKECHKGCAIFKQVGECIMPREGVFAKVLEGGEVAVKDRIVIEELYV